MNQPAKLSLEQEFQLEKFAAQVQHLSREQAQELLIELHRHMMMKDKMYQHFLLHEWNLDSGIASK
ncbi:MAG: NblA/ycf18 family protein [Cyanobacteria bacterium P01_A01_bin.83]